MKFKIKKYELSIGIVWVISLIFKDHDNRNILKYIEEFCGKTFIDEYVKVCLKNNGEYLYEKYIIFKNEEDAEKAFLELEPQMIMAILTS